MIAFLSVFLPGLGQLRRGDPRRAATLFGSAIVTGVLTGGVGWLACGVWSGIDYQRSAQPTRAGLPHGAAGTARAPASATGPNTSIGWIFKFSTLAICAAIVFQNIGAGNSLQTLKFFGVEMQFASALAARAGEVTDIAANADIADVADVADAFPSEESAVAASALQGGAAAPSEPVAAPASPPPSPSPQVPEFGGTWTSAEGARYDIARYGDEVRIIETSFLFNAPVETMLCDGIIDGPDLHVYCTTALGTNGEAQLSFSSNALIGQYTDHATGARIPVRLTR